MKEKVKIPYEVNNYIEALFIKDNYLRGLLFLLLSNDDAAEEDVDYYLAKTILSTMELTLAKEDMHASYVPSPDYSNFYMDFGNQEVIFYNE